MIPPTSIDGTDITGATIDGTDVQEITVDGDTVFTAGVKIPNVLGYYSFDDDSDSSIVVDDSGNGNDGTINSGATYTTDAEYGGNALDCTDPDVDFGSALPFDNEWAIAFLVKTTANTTSGDPNQLVTKGGDNPYIGEQDGNIRIRNGDGYGSLQSSVTINSGNYEHVIINATNNGDDTEIYKNNLLEETLDTSGYSFNSGDTFGIGSTSGGAGSTAGNPFKIDELYVVNQSLNSQQRTAIFNDNTAV